MTLLFEKSYQNGNGKGVGGVRCALKLVRPLINECLNDKIVHYSKKMKNKQKVKKQNEIPIKKMESKIPSETLNQKFNHLILADWFPELKQKKLGKLFGKIKSKFSRSGNWDKWIDETHIFDIRKESELVKLHMNDNSTNDKILYQGD